MSRAARQGFSLLELAVVLLIISLVVTFGLDIGRSALRGADRISVQEKLSIIQRSLEFYASSNGYLPCPARRDLTPDTSAGFGFQSRVGTGACTVAGDIQSSGGIITGMVPVRTLGLPDNYATDAWGNKILYAVSSSHVGDSTFGVDFDRQAMGAGLITVNTGIRTGTNYAITTNVAGTSGPAATYVALSHGPDGKGAYPLLGTAVATVCGATNAIDVENCNGDGLFYDSIYNDGTQADTFFDDFIVWGSNVLQMNPPPSTPKAPACVTGCEAWCAPCTNTTGITTVSCQEQLCDKFITSTTPCRATCMWSGKSGPTCTGARYRCP